MKREENKNLKKLINELQSESKKRKAADLVELRKPYYFKGRFNSLSNQKKREQIREYYDEEMEQTKKTILELYNLEELKGFSSIIEWVRSPTWGMNPRAKVIINNKICGYGCASGCGYDKLSAAICYATADNEQAKNIFLGSIVKAYARTGAPLPYGIYKTNKLYLHFDGCGVSALRSILEYCGLNNWTWQETKTSDYISATK